MTQFNSYTEAINFSALKEYCRNNGVLRHYDKGDRFAQQGERCRYLGFVESGYFKHTTLTSMGEEAVVGFAFTGEGVCEFNSAYRKLPSETSIIAGTASSIRQISIEKTREFFYSEGNEFLFELSDTLFREIYHRHLEIYRKTPAERYLDLVNNHPDIFKIVTMREIASYLRITPVYLSRIRKKNKK